ncbi:T9SS type A sorting domain-containing protein [Ekhidna sp. To15]|uniref:T9SS type A sorting domain-containing protein n=1 Tax=Ekhidna sp. To15 TaxID=3395267 RepID=UPI003F52285F
MKSQSQSILRKSCALALFTIAIYFPSFAQQDYYWVGGTGNWSDYANHWATSSGGSTFHSSLPTVEDNLYFDSNSFTMEGQSVLIDNYFECHDLDFTGVLFSPSISSNDILANGLTITGSLTLTESMSIEETYLFFEPSDGTQLLTSNGTPLTGCVLTFSLGDGGISLADSISTQSFSFQTTFNDFLSNGNAIHCTEEFRIGGSTTGELNFDNSNFYTKNFKVVNGLFNEGNLSMSNASVSIIYPDGVTRIRKDIHTEPLVTNYKIYENHLIENRAPIFDNLIIEPGVELLIDDAIDGVEFESLIANGTANEPISIKSDNAGTAATLIKSSGEVNLNYVILQDIEATGGATFNAFASEDNGNVTGFNFLLFDQEITFEVEQKDFEDIGDIYAPTPSASSGLEVTLFSDNEAVATVVNGNELRIEGMGTASITASQNGSDIFNAADPVIQILEVAKANQEITIEVSDTWIGDGFVNPNVSSSSNLEVTYIVIGPAELDVTTVVFTGVGTVQVRASQGGNDNYFAAPDVIKEFEVYKKEQTITFAEIANISEDAGFVNLDATSDSGLEVAYSVVGPGEVVDGAMEFTGNGMVQVTATQDGNDLYLEAEMVRRSFEIIAGEEPEKPLFLTQPEGLGTVYPNPVSDYLYFDPQIKIAQVRLSDLSGKIFYDGELSDEFLDVSSFDNGTYMLSITTDDRDTIVRRIVLK